MVPPVVICLLALLGQVLSKRRALWRLAYNQALSLASALSESRDALPGTILHELHKCMLYCTSAVHASQMCLQQPCTARQGAAASHSTSWQSPQLIACSIA